ncbi:hypothetical protein BC834DRAFT_848815 [Gloeopeniophorella convolvens]|nr:hypothetical protein BC834DRAFT_848815 [Gloeopeniophorella convolvens]
MTPPRRLPYKMQSHMVSCGMRTVAPTPRWEEGVLCVDSYLPWCAGMPLPLMFPEVLPNME